MDLMVKMGDVDALLKKFDDLPRVQEAALVSGLNKLGRSTFTEAKRVITRRYNIKSGDVANRTRLIGARRETRQKDPRHFVMIVAKGEGFPLFEFGGLPRRPYPQKGVPVTARKTATVKILKDAPRRKVTRDYDSGRLPFVAQMRSGHVGIFVGKYSGNFKENRIREIYSTLSVADMLAGRIGLLRQFTRDKGLAIFKSELRYWLLRAKG